jgi:ribosome-associated translation inhibitor RaiA
MYWSKLSVKKEAMGKIFNSRFLIWMLCVWPLLAEAQYTETREIVKRFAITPNTQIEIGNKYGKIDIQTWEKDSVVVQVKLKVEEKKQSKLEESLRGIDFDITANEHYLIFRTEVEKNKGSLAKEITKFRETLLSSDGNIQVDYTVWIPDANRLKVENKFGDVYIGDYRGDVTLNVSNGNLKAYDFSGNLDLTLNFADATINTIATGRLECNFSKLYLKKAESVNVMSKSTEFEFQEVRDMNADSRRDKFRIERIDLIDAQSSFTTFRVLELTDRMNIRADYGDIEVEKIAPDFGSIVIQSKSTDIDLLLPRESKLNFEINHIKSMLNLGSNCKVDEEKTSDDGKETRIKGHFGAKVSGSAKLSITADSGEINIRQR